MTPKTASHKTLAVEGNLTIRRVEGWLTERTPEESGRLVIDLSQLRNAEIGAGWRLGNAISLWSRRSDVTIRVPPTQGFSQDWFRTFTRSGLGLSLAAHRLSILDGDREITDEVRGYYQLPAEMNATNNVVVSGIDRRGELREPDLFADAFEEWAPYVGLGSFAPERKRRIPFLAMIREGLANVYDHAYRTPWTDQGSRLSYVSLRRYETISTATGPGSLDAYLDSLRDPTDVERLGFIEFVVVDDGCGVAARHSQDPAIYAGELEDEDEALGHALTSGESIKLRTRDAIAIGDPGYGFTYIAAGLREFHGYAELRTGRRLLVLNPAGSDRNGFEIQDETFGLMPGTVLHIIFPLDSDQLRFFK